MRVRRLSKLARRARTGSHNADALRVGHARTIMYVTARPCLAPSSASRRVLTPFISPSPRRPQSPCSGAHTHTPADDARDNRVHTNITAIAMYIPREGLRVPTSGPLPRRGPWRCTQSQSVSHHEYADRRDTHPHPIRQRSIQPIPIPSPTRISMCPFSSAFCCCAPPAQSRPRPAARTLKPCARACASPRQKKLLRSRAGERQRSSAPGLCARAMAPYSPRVRVGTRTGVSSAYLRRAGRGQPGQSVPHARTPCVRLPFPIARARCRVRAFSAFREPGQNGLGWVGWGRDG